MNYETVNYINKLTQLIIDTYDIELPIKSIDNLVEKFGGRVKRIDPLDLIFSGEVCKTTDDKFIIQISKEHSESHDRRKGLIALGHLFLHLGFRTSTEVWKEQKENYFRRFSDEAESQARYFASALLMPRREFFSAVDSNTNEDNRVSLEPIAKEFNVEPHDVVSRGQDLQNFYR